MGKRETHVCEEVVFRLFSVTPEKKQRNKIILCLTEVIRFHRPLSLRARARTHTRTHTHTHTHKHTHAHTHTRTHSLTHARTHVRTHARTHAHTYAHTYALTHSLTHAHTYVCIQNGEGGGGRIGLDIIILATVLAQSDTINRIRQLPALLMMPGTHMFLVFTHKHIFFFTHTFPLSYSLRPLSPVNS